MSQPTDPHQPQDPNQPQDPQGGTPASSPYGQSASYRQGTPSQPAAEQPAWGSAPSPATGPQAATGQAPATGQQPAGGAGGEAGFFKALFDFRFEHFITVKFSSFLYIIAFVVAALMWLSNIVWAIVFGAAWGSMNSFYGEGGFNAVPLILAIVFGWIPSVIALIAMRLGLEFAVATVRTAQHTSRIADSAQQR